MNKKRKYLKIVAPMIVVMIGITLLTTSTVGAQVAGTTGSGTASSVPINSVPSSKASTPSSKASTPSVASSSKASTGGTTSKPVTTPSQKVASNNTVDTNGYNEVSGSNSDDANSEDWAAVFAANSADSGVTSGPLNVGSVLKTKVDLFQWLFLGGIIAIAVGLCGLGYFIYAQFIYKSILRKRMAASQNTNPKAPKRGSSYKESAKPQLNKTKSEEPKQMNAPSAQNESEKVDWDQFFDDHK